MDSLFVIERDSILYVLALISITSFGWYRKCLIR